MMSNEPRHGHNDPGIQVETAAPVETASPVETSAPSRISAFIRVLVLAAVGAVTAVLAQLAISSTGEVFQLPPELAKLGVGQIPGPQDQARIAAGNLVLSYKHSALWLGTAGVLLGGLFGLTVGLFRSSAPTLAGGTATAVLVGALFGSAAGLSAIFLDQHLRSELPPGELAVPDHLLMLMHSATWLVMGAGIGLGVGLGAPADRKRTAARSMLLTAIAGLMGGLLYPFIAGVALPLADASLPIPEGNARLLWLGLPSVLIGLTLGRKI